MTVTQARMIQRTGTAAEWAATNPTLASGEFGYDSTNHRAKVGDGTSPWSDLAYLAGVNDSAVEDLVLDPGSDTHAAVVTVAGEAAATQITTPDTPAFDAVSTQIAERSALPSYVADRSRPHRFDPARCTYNFKPTNTRRLRAGLGRAIRGGMSRHVAVGDSMMAGAVYGITGAAPFVFDRPGSWPFAMRDRLVNLGVPKAGSGFIRANDNALGFPTGWTFSTSPSWDMTQKYYAATFGAGVATFTVPAEMAGATAYSHLWYDPGTGGGAYPFTLRVNGASSGPGFRSVTSVAGAGRYRVTTLLLTAPLVAGDTITVTSGGPNGHFFVGGNLWTPAAGGLLVHNLAQSGSRVYSTGASQNDRWASGSGASALGTLLNATNTAWSTRPLADGVITSGSNVLNSSTGAFTEDDLGRTVVVPAGQSGLRFPGSGHLYITAINSATQVTLSQNALLSSSQVAFTIGQVPDVMHLGIGANDLANGVSTTNIASGITAVRGFMPTTDVVLYVNPQPAASLIASATYDAWVSSLYDLADALDCPLVDQRARFGTFTEWSGSSLAGDGLAHANSYLFAEWGLSAASLLAG